MGFFDKYKFVEKKSNKVKQTVTEIIYEGISKNRQWLKDKDSVSGSKKGKGFQSWFWGNELRIKVGVTKLFKKNIGLAGDDLKTYKEALDDFEKGLKDGDFNEAIKKLELDRKQLQDKKAIIMQNKLATKSAKI
jgi:hypothetical protein